MLFSVASNCASSATPESSRDNSNNSPTRLSIRFVSSSTRSMNSCTLYGFCLTRPNAICILARGERNSCETWWSSLVWLCIRLPKRVAIASKSRPKSESSSRLPLIIYATLTSSLPLEACWNADRKLLMGLEKYQASNDAKIKQTIDPPKSGIKGNPGGGLCPWCEFASCTPTSGGASFIGLLYLPGTNNKKVCPSLSLIYRE